MKKAIAVSLCIVIALSFIPLTSRAAATIQYAAVTATDIENPGTYSLSSGLPSFEAAAALQDCIIIIVYSTDASGGSAIMGPVDSGGIHDKTVVLSDVSYSGHIGCRELILLGTSSVESTVDKYIISGSSAGDVAKPALTWTSLQNWSELSNAIADAKLKYTITDDKDIQEQWHIFDLEIESGKTLTIKSPGGDDKNRIIVDHSLIVNGVLAADEEQLLEIRGGLTNVQGLTLYDSDGNSTLDNTGNVPETFEYRNGRWIRLPAGAPPGGGSDQHSITLEYDTEKGHIVLDGRGENPGVFYFDKESNIPVRIEAKPGYQISDVVVDGTSVGAVAVYDFNNLSANHTLSVSFMPATYTITASAGQGGSIDPGGAVTVEHGSNKTFTFTPVPGYEVTDLIINGHSEGPCASFEFLNIQQDHTIEVIFSPAAPERHRITLNYNSDRGIIRIDGVPEDNEFLVDNGHNKNVEIEARDGYRISTLKINQGDPVIVNNRQYSFQLENISEDTTIFVEFTAVTYTITASAGDNGTISPDGSVIASYDDHVEFVITPDYGYMIHEVLVDGEPMWIPNKYEYLYEFRHVREDHSISASFMPRGDGSTHTITVEPVVNGTVEAEGLTITDGIVTVQDGYDITFIITPDPGYGLSSAVVRDFDEMRNVVYKNDRTFELTIREVTDDLTLSVTFIEESLEGILCKSYAVLQEDAQSDPSLKAALAREFGYMGFAVEADRITVSDKDISDMDTFGYGTFNFKVEVGTEKSDEITGYIVPEFTDVIFKYEGAYNGSPITANNKIRVAHAQDGENGLFSAPAMDSGSIEIFGPYNTHMEGWMSPDVRDAFELDGNKMIVLKSFYRVQLHIGNTNDSSPGSHTEHLALNWFGFDLIQDDAYCVKVDARSEAGTQRTLQWGLNRYAILNTGDYVSQVFFGNDTFELSIPEDGIGGATEISLETGDFQGYSVSETEPGRRFEVFFKSDFYDRVILDVTINNSTARQLTVHRVGVDIVKEVYNPDRGPDVSLFHGTQNGTRLDFSGGDHYRIYATYCIPDGGTVAPYGLYVTYTFSDGTKTSKIITEYCDNPPENINSEEYRDGVFIYGSDAACCDYLIYSAKDSNNAPVKVCVTVLKGNPLSGVDFDGIFFGSGAGVLWTNE